MNFLEKRYETIRKANPSWKKCSISECKNPRDSTQYGGEDTCCAFHRLLFDWWICEVASLK